MSVPQQIQDIKGCLISPVGILQIAARCHWLSWIFAGIDFYAEV